MNKPYVFFEPFAGSAAVTYGLLGSKSPISYMGSKSGFFLPIVGVMGLSTAHPPSAIVLGEPGPWAAVHACLAGATGVSAEEVANWLVNSAWTTQSKGDVYLGPDRVSKGHEEGSTRAITLGGIERSVHNVGNSSANHVAAVIRQWKDEEPRALWTRLKQEGWASLLNEGEGRWLGPVSIDDVARFLHANALSMVKNGLATGYSHVNGEGHHFVNNSGENRYWTPTTPEVTGERIETAPRFPPTAVWQGKAEDIPLPEDMSNYVTFCDPPYQGTTKYPHGDCSRETVLRLAKEWSRRGSIVAISEAVSLKNELGDGWFDVRIDHARKGSVRTFSKQKDEWVTINRVPQYIPPKQVGLFGQ